MSTLAAPLPTAPWYFRRWVIIPSLIIFYPIGLTMLWLNPHWPRWRKIVGTILCLPCGVALALILLMPYWDFGGSMAPWTFSLDFGKGESQYRTVEKHRAGQKSAPAASQSTGSLDPSLTWTDFRGSMRDGIVHGATISKDWKAYPPKEIYRQPIGEGYASFVVEEGRAYTIEQRRKQEVVVCYDFLTGRELWTFAYDARFTEPLGGDGPRATPTLHAGKLYCLGAAGHFHCLDSVTGRKLWEHDIHGEYNMSNLPWALAGSPLIVDGNVLVTSSGNNGPAVLAYNAETGSLVWKSQPRTQGYSSLSLATLAGKRVVLNLAALTFDARDPATGEIVWTFPWETSMGINCSQPILAGDDRVFLSSGYGKGCALIKIEKQGDKLAPRELWSNTRMKNKFASSVIHRGHIYGLDEGILTCLAAGTGDRKWKGGRYGHGSILLVDDRIIVLSEEGVLALVEATPDAFRELGSLQNLPGRTWNNFIVLGDKLLARNHKEMVCLNLAP
jgi:outer membrane protein assembly factor BamB